MTANLKIANTLKVPSTLKIACIGEAMIELAFEGTTPLVNFAGDALNTAIYLRRNLSPHHRVSFVSTLGEDPFSNRMLDFIASEAILTDSVSRHPTLLPGLYAIDTAPDGERSFLYWRENSAARQMFREGFAQLADFDVLYFSAITLAILPPPVRQAFLSWLADFKKTGCERTGLKKRVVFDSNYRLKLWPDVPTAQGCVKAAWRLADIGLPSLDDEMALFKDETEQDVLTRLNNWGVSQGALKRGSRGPRSLDARTNTIGSFEKARTVVDTTAAGDSFNGAFLARYLETQNAAQAMTCGHKCSLKVIAQKGAIVPK